MSQTSLGMGSGIDESSGSGILEENLTPEGGRPPGELAYDCIAYVIFCREHDRIALTRSLKDNQVRCVWFPFCALSSSGNWKGKAEEGIQLILKREDPELESKFGPDFKIPVSEPKRLQIHRTQIPVIQKFVTRLIYWVRLEKTPDLKCCENTKRIQWYSLNEVINGRLIKLWGPEVRQFAILCKKPKSQGISEYTLKNVYQFVADQEKGPQSNEEELLREMSIGIKEIEVIYSDFLDHCFPSIQMTIHSFKDYLNKYGYNTDDRRFLMLFNAFDYNINGFINFTQLLIGLIFMDKNSPHRESRLGFVFRYYDIDCDGFLNHSELKSLIRDTNRELSGEAIDQKSKDWFQTMNTVSKTKCSYNEFSAAVGSLKLRGTSSLCRTEKSLLNSITKSVSNREIEAQKVPKFKDRIKEMSKDEALCLKCRTSRYEYGIHGVNMDTDGRTANIHHLREMRDDIEITNPSRVYSLHFTFEEKSLALTLIDLIRDFNLHKYRTKDKGFAFDDDTIASKFSYICKNLEQIFALEQRVVKIGGPVYLIGDLFGSLSDLMIMESNLWQSFPVLSANYVFLGNYVNFGKWGVEVVLYLFCLKLISPNKVFLLRGRHEIREIQIKNTFQKECIEKYSETNGKRIWQMINQLFDSLPFALIIDETVFCVNSGIPNVKTRVQDLNKVNKILKNPSIESPIVWQLLSNEFNIKTKNVFTEENVNSFLTDNGLTHIICGNRQTANGFEIRLKSKLINVFSSTEFNSKCAVILLKNHKIRVIRLEIPKEDLKTASDFKTIV